jgi:hypothetical protein
MSVWRSWNYTPLDARSVWRNWYLYWDLKHEVMSLT